MTTTATTAAVIYARVSKDLSGRQSSVTQQVTECRAECERRGWEIRDEITDNDISASRYATKDRPGYRRLMNDLRPGEVLVVWEPSRVGRKLDDHLALRHLCEDNGILFCAGGDLVDFRKPGDRFSAGVKAQVDEYSSDQTRDRILRDTRARAQSGRPHGNLGFGYLREFDNSTGTTSWVVDSGRAPIVREIATRLLRGEALYSVAADLNARGIPAPGRGPKEAGRPWRPQQLKALILRPAYAGLRQFQGAVIRQGNWEPILTEDEHQRLTAVLRDPSRLTTHVGPKTRHLLSGIPVCDVCERPVRWAHPKGRNPQYRCPKGHVGRNAAAVEAQALKVLFEIIEEWRCDTFLRTDPTDETPHSAYYFDEARTLQQRIDAATDQFSAGKLSAGALARIEATLMPQITDLQEKGRASTSDPVLARLAEDAPTMWETFNLEQQRMLLKAALDVRLCRATAEVPVRVEIRKSASGR